jgi:ABC-2 type transport system ATP-binding protein
MADARVMIELAHLSRHFGPTRAVDDISFQVHAGEVFGYIGPNGAGKTTSMRILATLDLPNGGDAFIDGFSVVNDPDRVRQRLGFMPDSFGTYPNVNVREYLDFFARAYELRGADRQRVIRRVMEFTRLDVLADKPIDGLSKGMKQRLCLGRALIHDPAVLVLDEPAAGLDPRARIELRDMIRQLTKRGKTVLISSHILTELAEICDRVAILERGRLIAVGSVEEIQKQGQTVHHTVEVSVIDGKDTFAEWLARQAGISQIQQEGPSVRFLHEGDHEADADLLKAMIDAGFRVTAFGARRHSLEDVFMQVTKGLVQ